MRCLRSLSLGLSNVTCIRSRDNCTISSSSLDISQPPSSSPPPSLGSHPPFLPPSESPSLPKHWQGLASRRLAQARTSGPASRRRRVAWQAAARRVHEPASHRRAPPGTRGGGARRLAALCKRGRQTAARRGGWDAQCRGRRGQGSVKINMYLFVNFYFM